MAYKPIQWKNHVVSPGNTYNLTENDDGTVTLTPVGSVIQQGTNMSAANFNHMEEGIVNATEVAALLTISMIHQQQATRDIKGETITVTLTNTEEYPFNNSLQTIALEKNRDNKDYTVTAEITAYSGGFPGNIKISSKLKNGFKVASTGSAKSVTVNLCVKGGLW